MTGHWIVDSLVVVVQLKDNSAGEKKTAIKELLPANSGGTMMALCSTETQLSIELWWKERVHMVI